MGVGPWQLAVIVLVILLVFGASRLGEIGRGLGEGVRAFRKSMNEGERRRRRPRQPEQDDDRASQPRLQKRKRGRERAVQNRRHVMVKPNRDEDDEERS